MNHLYSSVIKVQRLTKTRTNGMTETTWVDQSAPLNAVRCRLDLNFLRPGKDVPPAHEAGVAPNRIGVMFCAAGLPLRAGDRIVTVSGPVSGTFDIETLPDEAVGFSAAHHIEVQIVESVQKLEGKWPT